MGGVKEPGERLELSTYGLRNRCSTTELSRPNFKRTTGIEPVTCPWEGHILPLNYARIKFFIYLYVDTYRNDLSLDYSYDIIF